MTTVSRFRIRTLALVCSVLGTCAVARAQSAVEGFNPGANGPILALAVQPDGKILVGGGFSMLGGGGFGTIARSNLGRLNVDGSLDLSFNPGANSSVRALAVQADGKILVGGNFTALGGGTGTTTRNYLGRLNADGSVDASFNPGASDAVFAIAVEPDGKILVGGYFGTLGGGGFGTTLRLRLGRLNADGSLDSFNPGANQPVYALAVQPDGKIVVGGDFTGLGGGTGNVPRNYLGRLTAAGAVDFGFSPGANLSVRTLAVRADGRILVGGYFTGLGGATGTTPRNYLGGINSDGSVDPSFNPGANAAVLVLRVQPDGKILAGGEFSTLGGGGTGMASRAFLGRLVADGSIDPSFDPGANGAVLAAAIQTDGKILAGGNFTTLGGGATAARSFLGRVNADGSLEASFNPGANGAVFALAVQPDGKILAGGNFTTLGGGGSGTALRNKLGRLNADGTLDPTFNPGANDLVRALAVQPDGKILVGGQFTTLGGGGIGTTSRSRLGRLNTDGSLDSSFNPGLDNSVFALAVQPDGKILVGGSFTTVGGGGTGTTTRFCLARLNADGTVDLSFDPGMTGQVFSLAVQPDGKILVAGGMPSTNYLGRLNEDGSVDPSFFPDADTSVYVLALQPDGKILIGGTFRNLGAWGPSPTPRKHVARLNADGSPDSSFDPGASAAVWTLALQTDGKILVGGAFTTLGGGGFGTMPRSRLGRLNADGSDDPSFNPGASSHVDALAVQPDGKIVVGGVFTMLGGGGTGTTARTGLGRLTNTDAGVQSLAAAGAGNTITWSRSGAGPEIGHTTFESSLDGTSYTLLGSGTRVAGGWQASGASLPGNQNVYVRARGYYQTGYGGGSVSVVESVRNVYVSVALPTVVTTGASVIDRTSATLRGKATPNGTATTGRFEYGLTTGYGSTTPAQEMGSGMVSLAIDGGSISGLTCNTQYHLRATATNPGGTAAGLDASFTTTACVAPAVTTYAASGITATTATLNGTANPNGSATTGRFEYGLTPGYGSTTAPQSLGSGGIDAVIGGGALTNLACGTLYYFRATATNASGTTDGAGPTFMTDTCPTSGSSIDGFDPGANAGVNALAVQPDGKIVVGGAFTMLGGGAAGTTARNYLGRLNANGFLDTSFDPGANGPVNALAVQPDGKILVGGQFTMLGGGGTGAVPRNNLGRLNADGSPDVSFNPGASSAVYTLTIQPDGKILVGGQFTMLGGGGTGTTPRFHLGRLNADGSLDASFNPGANAPVRAMAVQPDGKILVAGQFTMLGGGGTGGTPRNDLGRLNANGSLDPSFDPGANGVVNALAVQPDGKIVVGGGFTTLGGGGAGTTLRNDLGRLNPDGTLDPSFDPGANGVVNALTIHPNGQILIGGAFTMLGGGGTGTTSRSRLGRLDADGVLDPSLDPGANNSVWAIAVDPNGTILVAGAFTMLGGGGTGTTPRNYLGRLTVTGPLDTSLNPGANGDVNAVALQPDGKIVVGGHFTALGGGTGTIARQRLGRFNPDGSLETAFDPGANGGVISLAIQPDGKIVVVGVFTLLGGGGSGTVPRSRLGRLNADGSLDPSFDPGADNLVYAVALQPDGKILIAGSFSTVGGGGTGTTARSSIARLNADGSVDASFDPGANNAVYALAVQPDGRILVGGVFTMLGGGGTGTTVRHGLGRLNSDGSLDASFDPGANAVVFALAVQPDGQVVVGGAFTLLGGGGIGTMPRSRLGRLDSNGVVDASFDPGTDSILQSLAVQADGKILAGGFFTTLGGGGTGTTARRRIGRLNADGSLDASLDPGANNYVLALAVQPDGKILAGGAFTMLGGGGTGTTARNSFGRVTNSDAALQTLVVAPGGGTVTWLRSGTSPEVWRTTFESSTDDGTTYTPLGSGVRVAGGWEMSGLSLAVNQNILIRARGYYQTGYLGGSGSIVESARRVYVFAAPPTTVTGSASGIGITGATLNGTANPNGTATTGSFEYGLTTGYGTSTPGQSLGVGIAAAAIGGGAITSLTCNTLYHFRAVGANAAATVNGLDATFTTGACPPTVVTGAANGIGVTSATLNGTANPHGTATTANFEYGLTAGYGSTTSAQNMGSGTVAAAMGGGAITGLTCNTLYHFRAVGTNATATVTGVDATFTTAACVPPAITTHPANQMVTVGGTATFTAAASGNPAPTAQWQVSTNGGGTFSDIAGATSATYAFTTAAIDSGRQYHAVFSNAAGVATTSAATLSAPPPTMSLDRTSLNFAATTTGTAFSSQTGSQVVRLAQSGPGTVGWTAVASSPWLIVSPASGTGSATLTVSIGFVSGLTSAQSGTVALGFTGAANTAGPIAVTLTTHNAAQSTAPTGSFDTPTDGSTGIAGSLAVTGWAVDDIEVTRVRILRDPVPGEAAGHLVFIGDAISVEGARPDVQDLFPNVPWASRAGWGYLMLTNFLPNGGNGTFKLYAVADDADGHSTILGWKTITCTNSSSTLPFGAIDTPGQGETVSGMVNNFGWVLSPGARRADPLAGGQVYVFIDGAPVGSPVGWTDRGDLTALFPADQYEGIGFALGVFTFDSTTLTNGVHTIAWGVTDNQGGGAGVGSRYFRVSNGAGALTAAITAPLVESPQTGSVPAPMLGRRGFNSETPLSWHGPDVRGHIIFQAEELDRIELRIGAATGHLRTSEGLQPLPIGSQLDANGTFLWHPGVAFVGPYEFVFQASDGAERQVWIILNPKASSRVGPQVIIDAPTQRQTLEQPFALTGWAADLDSQADTGIDAIQVWAYPVSGAEPRFLGTAALDEARPDVGAIHGDAFKASGYAMSIQGLPPGDYDLAVFAWSKVRDGFVPKKTVRVTVR